MSHWDYPQTEKERANPFIDLRSLCIAEEDLPPNHRGGPYRRFRSQNVIDLVRVRRAALRMAIRTT